MSTVITNPETDVVVIGLGVCGGIIATELATSGIKVVGIEKGLYYNYLKDWVQSRKSDEWSGSFEKKFDHNLAMWVPTWRHNSNQVALPLRRYMAGAMNIVMGNSVGGAGCHYGSSLGRIGPWAFEPASETASTYGSSFLSNIQPTNDLEDWPISYTDATPYFNTFEQSWGVAGSNQNPFTPNVTYPLPPHPSTPLGELFNTTTESMGYHPRNAISANTSGPYVNQYGVTRNACVYDGWCGDFYDCEVGAKTSTHVSHIPAAVSSGNFTMILNSVVSRINVDSSTGKATGVTYSDSQGNVYFQPASVVVEGAYALNNQRLTFLSGIGQGYNPTTRTGTLGRGLHQADLYSGSGYGLGAPTAGSYGIINSMGANGYAVGNNTGGGFTIEDTQDDNFSHTGLNFVGGVPLSVGSYGGGGYSQTFTAATSSPSNMGSQFKASLKDSLLPTKTLVYLGNAGGPELPDLDWYSDLDPLYYDMYGDPLLRLTQDFGMNPFSAAAYIAPIGAQILTKMGCTNITQFPGAPGTTHPNGGNIHIRGGMRMGSNASTSQTNQWLQSWDVPNLFASSEANVTFGDNTTAGTHTIGMISYIAADGIKQYLKSPSELA